MPDYDIITTERELDSVLLELSKHPRNSELHPIVLDVETMPGRDFDSPELQEAAAKDRFTAELAGFGISWRDDQAVFFPLTFLDGNNFKFDTIVESTEQELLNRLSPYLTQWPCCNHLARYDWGILKRRGLYVNYQYCTYVEALSTGKYFDLFRGDQGGSDAGLKSLVLREFGHKMQTIDELAKFSDGYHIERVPSETAAWYGCEDVDWDGKLHRLLYPQVEGSFIFKLEMAVTFLVEWMEENGIPFKSEHCKNELDKLHEFTPIAKEIIYSQVERQLGKRIIFEIDNPSQKRKIYFDPPPNGLGLPVQRKSKKTGVPSTDAKSMAKLAKDFNVVHNVLTHGQLTKADTSFLATLPSWIHPLTNRIHSTFHQAGVPSGRFASSAPNAQNWSKEKIYKIKDDYPSTDPLFSRFWSNDDKAYVLTINVRDSVCVDEDELLVEADYKQVEFWGACELAHEDGMLDLMMKGYDPHSATASMMYHVPLDAVTEELRHRAKTRNFAFLFGETPQGAAEKEGLPLEEVMDMIRRHEKALAKVIADRQAVIGGARRNGFVSTHFGRKIDLTQLYQMPDKYSHEKADRLAYNARIQGTFTGDLPKMAMVRCMRTLAADYEAMPGGVVKIPIIHNGHDALTFRLTPRVRGDLTTVDLPGFVKKIKLAMEIHIPGFKLPARIDVKVGRKLGSMLKYSGESAEEIDAKIKNKALDKPKINGVAKNGNGNGNGGLKLQLHNMPTPEQALALKALLTQYPGDNQVILQYGADSIPLKNYPTSLTIKDAEKFGIVLPCKVLIGDVKESVDFLAKAMDTV